ncbi:MAG: DUF2568 domain-containing protein [Anaerolineae bacterium]|nr:DUF2568 domain-containing protein [Anaerolineae bacterium]
MSQNPANLALRFALELAALAALSAWALARFDGVLSIALAVLLPVIAATLWATFRVPGDSSASGRAPVPVPGIVRLLLELALFALGVLALVSAGYTDAGTVLGIAVVVHYALSYDRIIWLLRGESRRRG